MSPRTHRVPVLGLDVDGMPHARKGVQGPRVRGRDAPGLLDPRRRDRHGVSTRVAPAQRDSHLGLGNAGALASPANARSGQGEEEAKADRPSPAAARCRRSCHGRTAPKECTCPGEALPGAGEPDSSMDSPGEREGSRSPVDRPALGARTIRAIRASLHGMPDYVPRDSESKVAVHRRVPPVRGPVHGRGNAVPLGVTRTGESPERRLRGILDAPCAPEEVHVDAEAYYCPGGNRASSGWPGC
jgi:hypothetical protein